MSNKTVVFQSILGELSAGYIEEKRAVGYKYKKGSSLLKQFDKFLIFKFNASEIRRPHPYNIQYA